MAKNEEEMYKQLKVALDKIRDPYNPNTIPAEFLILYGIGQLEEKLTKIDVKTMDNKGLYRELLKLQELKKAADQLNQMVDGQLVKFPQKMLATIGIDGPIDVEFEEVEEKKNQIK